MQVKYRLKYRYLDPASEMLILVLWNTTQEVGYSAVTLDDTRVQGLYLEECCQREYKGKL